MHHQSYSRELLENNFYPFDPCDSCPESFDDDFSPSSQDLMVSNTLPDLRSEIESVESPVVNSTCPVESSLHLTDLCHCKETLSVLSEFHSGQIGQHLKKYQGLLILPLHAVSIFRVPSGKHVSNVPILIYFPTNDISQYQHLANFNDSLKTLYS